jgi:hypothetical protein
MERRHWCRAPISLAIGITNSHEPDAIAHASIEAAWQRPTVSFD